MDEKESCLGRWYGSQQQRCLLHDSLACLFWVCVGGGGVELRNDCKIFNREGTMVCRKTEWIKRGKIFKILENIEKKESK